MRRKFIRLDKIVKYPKYFPFEISWKDLKISKISILHSIFSFLGSNYIEDNTSTFRFYYVHDFLNFVLKIQNWNENFNLGINFRRGRKLIGFISALSKYIILKNYFMNGAEINFLCLEKKIRLTGLASTLIQEITRRLNSVGTSYAMFTTAISFGQSFLTCRYYHYPINFLKLYEIGFLKSKFFYSPIKNYRRRNNFFIKKKKKEIYLYEAFRKNNRKLNVYYIYGKKEYINSLKTLEGVFYVFFFSFKQKNNIKFTSFYFLPNKILKGGKKTYVYGCYWYVGFFKISLKILFKKTLKILYQLGFDIFNLLGDFSQKFLLKKIGFKMGTGLLFFHIFNMIINKIKNEENSLSSF